MIATTSRLPRLYTVDEVATYLRLSTKTVRRLIASGDMHCGRAGTKIRVSEADLQAFLHSRSSSCHPVTSNVHSRPSKGDV